MVSKHFLKTLILFMGMIALGLLGVFLVSYFDGYFGEAGDGRQIRTEVPDKSAN